MRDVLKARWSETGDKIVALAEEFPADQYDFTPVPGTRSFGDQLRHVAFWNGYVRATLRGEAADGAANELPREKFPTKAKVLAALKSSFADVAAELSNGHAARAEANLDTMVSFIEHGGEHYGQLVFYYRSKGLVPPASRG